MNKQSAFPMSNEAALELVREFLQPGMPTLGDWFGWNQPNPENTVKLGSVYGGCTSENFYWEEVFGLKDWAHVAEPTLEDKKDFIRFMKAHKKSPRMPFKLSGIWSAEEVFFPFNQMDIGDQMLYRLMVMSVNTCGTDYHEWSIELGEDLAEKYCQKKAATCEWELYEGGDNFTTEFVERFKDLVDLNIYLEEGDHYPQGIVEKDMDHDTVLWVEEFVEDFTGAPKIEYQWKREVPAEDKDFYFWMFGVRSDEHTYWQSDVNQVLAWFIDWMKNEWREGNLTLTSHENMPIHLKSLVEMCEKSD